MRIKSIEIQGFKSFGEKQVLELSPRTNVIVGPNGSGKSNLIDAINWVLGEQNARSLRGEKMEDIIFSGSTVKKPVGMAQVVLWVDNSDEDMPLDYHELTITRRLFRSGESQFRINKIPCRLKDIRELFAGTGSGRGSLSLMSQGQVDQILNSKPSYRREVFEEAAGISKHRGRQQESLYHLSKIEGDLAYLSQLAAEVENSLQVLRIEAQKAREFLRVRENKTYLESILITRELTRLYREFAVCTTRKQALALACEKAALQNEFFQELLKEPVQQLKTKREIREETAREKVRLQLEKEHLRDRMEIARERKTWLEGRREECVTFIEKNGQDLRDLIHRQETEKGNLEKVQQEMRTCREELELQKQQLENLNSLVLLTEKKSKRISSRYVDALSEKARIGNQLSSVEKELSMMEKETGHFSLRLKGLQENHRALSSKIASEKKQSQGLSDRLAGLTKEAANCEEEVRKLETQLHTVEKELQNTRDNHVQLSSRQKLLAEMQKRYEGYAFPVQELLKHGTQLSGICGVVGDLLEVPEKYRIAVEIALGGKINNIVTETTEDAKAAIQFLKKRNAGRLTFLPLDVIHSTSTITESSDLPGVRLASSVVKVENKYQAIVDYLLGRILVVEDLDAGLKVAGRTGYKLSIVTEKGEMLHPGGALTGGSLKKGSGGLVGRKKTVERLESDIQKLLEKMTAISKKKAALEHAILQERDKGASFAGEITKVSMRLQELETGMEYSANQIQALKREEAILKDEQLELSGSRDEIEKTKNQLLEQNSRLGRRLERMGHILERREHVLGDLRKESENASSAILNTEIKLSTLEQKYNYSRQNLEQFKGLRSDMTARHGEKKSDLKRIVAEGLATERDILRIEQKLRSNQKSYEEMERSHQELEDWISRLQEKERVLTHALGRITSRRQEIEEEYSNSKNRYLALRMEIDRLERAMMADEALCFVPLYTVDPSEVVDLDRRVASLQRRLKELDPVNISSIQEFSRIEKEKAGFAEGIEDLKAAHAHLQQISRLVERRMSKEFSRFFGRLQVTFNETYQRVFGGGSGQLVLQGDSILEGDIDIFVQPPGKRQQPLSLLSGGERALTALTLLFAILEENRSPFCILDEVDTSLDENNIENFTNLLEYYSASTQFIIVSHRQGTMEAADNLFGVTMPEEGVSTIVSVNLQREVG